MSVSVDLCAYSHARELAIRRRDDRRAEAGSVAAIPAGAVWEADGAGLAWLSVG